MSAIAAINVAGPQTPATIAAAPSGLPASQPQTTSSNATRPAVVVSLSSGAAATTQAPSAPPALDPNQVDNALSWAAGANGEALLYKHVDRTLEAAKFGNAISERNQAGLLNGVVASTSHAISYASNLGIPIQASVSPEAVKNGAAPGTISVGAFSFTNGGSTYSVTPGANGTLIGTKDGQAWKTWQLTDPAASGTGAATALQALTSLSTQQKPSADKPLSGIDVSA